MTRILMTGATGWIGSLVTAELARRGHAVCCVIRAPSGERRLRELIDADLMARISTVAGDVTRPRAGVADPQRAALRGAIDLVVHAAALVRLDGAAEQALVTTNVDGTSHVLDLADELGSVPVVHVSTCSVAGDAKVFSERDVEVGQTLRNGYERTKLDAEKLVAAWPGRSTILRVPGVVGDAATGACRWFSGAFYRALAAYFSVREDLAAEWRGGDRAGLEQEGIVFAADGTLRLPLHLPFNPDCPCAIVPQDWLAATIADLVERSPTAGVFHLAHPSPPTVGWVLGVALDHLGIAAPNAGAPVGAGPWTRFVRRSLDRIARYQFPYLQSVPRLRCERLREALGPRYVPPPDLDAALVQRVIDRAVQARFE